MKPKVAAGRVQLYVQPRASRTEIVGFLDGWLKVRLAAPPVDGEANKALVEFLAAHLDVAKSGIRIVAGQASRRKTVEIDGMTTEAIHAALGA
ncbi:MAG TPA: DUF167 domain-containing protein [Steroidobacteraceae bacterium]|nr:DUF167 domain-containing protein [Steroidobacteraceae bacterium]